jgi:hypothetical protein
MFIFMEMNVCCMRHETDGECSENHSFLRLVQNVLSYDGTYIVIACKQFKPDP